MPLTAALSSGNQEPLPAAPVFARHINLMIVDDRTIYMLELSKGSGGFQVENDRALRAVQPLFLINTPPALTHLR